MNFFGYTIGKKENKDKEIDKSLDVFSPEENKDGSVEIIDYDVDYSGNQKYIYDFEQKFGTEEKRINEYRRLAKTTEADYAITDIVNESIVQDQLEPPVTVNLDKTEFSESIKKKIQLEWDIIESLFDLTSNADEMFRQWYIDGKIYYHKVVNSSKTTDGIKELRLLDPKKIKKVRETKKSPEGKNKIAKIVEYYIYSLQESVKEDDLFSVNFNFTVSSSPAMEIYPDMIAYAHSGWTNSDGSGDIVYSYLQKAIKPINQLALTEDALVVYRYSRAPEKRVFYVDVGNLNRTRAAQYMRSIIDKYKNKFVYNANSGKIETSKKNMTMMEDIWLPRKEGNRGTEVTTLPGGQNLGELSDLMYFKEKVYKALNVPLSRLQSETAFNIGRSSEITRDEIRFAKFAQKLRTRFSSLFYDVLKTQLILKKIITEDDWDKEKTNIRFVFKSDSLFEELKDQEILQSKIEILNDITQYVGRYYSDEWVKKKLLKQSDEEIKEIEKYNSENKPPVEENQ